MNIRNYPVVIANAATASAALDLGSGTVCGIYIPSSFTGTSITFTSALTFTGTYAPVKDGAGAAVSKTVAAGDYVYLDPAIFAGIQYIKVVSGSAEGAARTVTFAVRPV